MKKYRIVEYADGTFKIEFKQHKYSMFRLSYHKHPEHMQGVRCFLSKKGVEGEVKRLQKHDNGEIVLKVHKI